MGGKMFGFKHFVFEVIVNLEGKQWKFISSIEK